MWHENAEEMMEYLKSVFRVDVDYRFENEICLYQTRIMCIYEFDNCFYHLTIFFSYSKRRLAQKYFGVNDPDYYEWETHIFFDDAFKKGPADAPGDKPVRYHYKYYHSNLRKNTVKLSNKLLVHRLVQICCHFR